MTWAELAWRLAEAAVVLLGAGVLLSSFVLSSVAWRVWH